MAPRRRRVVFGEALLRLAPIRLDVAPGRRVRMARAGEHELHHVARPLRAVGEAGVDHVEVQQKERAGRHVVQNHAGGRDRIGVEVAAGLNARRPHGHRRVVRKVEADQIAGQVMARPGEGALGVLVPAGTGPGAFAHRRRVGFGGERRVDFAHRRAAVNGAVRMQVVVGPGDGRHGAAHHRAVQDLVHLRDARDDVVAVPGLLLDDPAQRRVDLLVQCARHVRRQTQEAVGDEPAHLLVVQ